MKIEVNITKRYFFTIIGLILILTSILLGYAYNQPLPNPGHGADTVWVTANGKEQTLQQAIDAKEITKTLRDSDFCVYISTQVGGQFSWKGWLSINTSLNGRNICSDVTGCAYKITRFAFQENAGDAAYGSSDSYIRQVRNSPTTEQWFDSAGNNQGVNGDGVGQYFDSDIWSNSGEFADDSGGITTLINESSSDSFIFHDNSATYAFIVTVCDF